MYEFIKYSFASILLTIILTVAYIWIPEVLFALLVSVILYLIKRKESFWYGVIELIFAISMLGYLSHIKQVTFIVFVTFVYIIVRGISSIYDSWQYFKIENGYKDNKIELLELKKANNEIHEKTMKSLEILSNKINDLVK